LDGPADLELIAVDGRLELTVADVSARVEQCGCLSVIVADRPMGRLSVDETRAAVERIRR
jgi:hypothetical protein